MPPKPGREILWAKLQQQKARHQLEERCNSQSALADLSF
ncbi:hypothetical protein MC7420_7760 [Coleofasciculus chthonoplastes PCC 7420]|uniref:Uncharacterized protein n=1 Tax=Coleofasciculus chthonoplastes PCC 7420 TaxID=118168 RepID=B4VJJ8_9CYAN|nr:hypothetical protein MC7420_7760 [Coleofasciculus chthonoplastes PCC 7420]